MQHPAPPNRPELLNDLHTLRSLCRSTKRLTDAQGLLGLSTTLARMEADASEAIKLFLAPCSNDS